MRSLSSWICVLTLLFAFAIILPACSPPPSPSPSSGAGSGEPSSTTTDVGGDEEIPAAEEEQMPVDEPAAEESAAEEASSEPASASESAATEVPEETTEEQPAEEEAAPATPDEPTAEEPAAEEPAAPGPATEEPTTEQAAVDASGDWGTLKGRIVYGGTPPEPVKATITKDEAFCGKFDVLDEELVVSQDGSIVNAVVSLYLGRGDDAPAVHPSYAETAEADVALDNKGCRFEPHICLLRTTQTLRIGNKDEVGHNTKVDTFSNDAINPIIPAGGQTEAKFPEAERVPIPVSCSIHPWMKGYLVIRDHPYTAVTNEKGEFEIKNLPVGTWTFHFWQEKSGNLSDVTVGGEQAEWSRGRVELQIKPGVNDLGEIKVNPALFTE